MGKSVKIDNTIKMREIIYVKVKHSVTKATPHVRTL